MSAERSLCCPRRRWLPCVRHHRACFCVGTSSLTCVGPTTLSHAAQAAREIAHTVANAANRVYLQADSLLLNLAHDGVAKK